MPPTPLSSISTVKMMRTKLYGVLHELQKLLAHYENDIDQTLVRAGVGSSVRGGGRATAQLEQEVDIQANRATDMSALRRKDRIYLSLYKSPYTSTNRNNVYD